jgi:hypothetical protein
MTENTVVQGAQTEDSSAQADAGKQPVAPKVPSPRAPAAKKVQAAEIPVPITTPIFKNRHDKTFRHDVFKCQPSIMKKNESFKHLEPLLVDVEHAHIFHTSSHTGQQNDQTQKMGGHFHYVTLSVNQQSGELEAKCGPAMMEDTFMAANGQTYKNVIPLGYKTILTKGPNKGQEGMTVDDHTHVMTWEGSEELGGSISRAKLEEAKAEAAAYGIRVDGVKTTTPPPSLPSDSATIT